MSAVQSLLGRMPYRHRRMRGGLQLRCARKTLGSNGTGDMDGVRTLTTADWFDVRYQRRVPLL